MVREVGFGPTRYFYQEILSPLRLPVTPLSHNVLVCPTYQQGKPERRGSRPFGQSQCTLNKFQGIWSPRGLTPKIKIGARQGIRTHTKPVLSRTPLPIGIDGLYKVRISTLACLPISSISHYYICQI